MGSFWARLMGRERGLWRLGIDDVLICFYGKDEGSLIERASWWLGCWGSELLAIMFGYTTWPRAMDLDLREVTTVISRWMDIAFSEL